MTLPAQPLQAILFDFDGTLLDSFSTHYQAFEITFKTFGIPITQADYLRSYSPNWYQVYRALGLPEAVWEQAEAVWLEAAARLEPHLYPGAETALHRLTARYPLGLVTAGSKERVYRDLRRTGIQDYFAVVVTGDDVQERKPAPDGLLQALAALNVLPDRAVYVGDTIEDYQMARLAGMAYIAVASQYSRPLPQDDCLQVSAIADLPGVVLGRNEVQ